MTAATVQPTLAVTRRPRTPADDDFLFALFASTRDDVAGFGWDDVTVEQFLRFQYAARDRSYAAHPHARSEIVVVDGAPAGRLLVDHRPDAVHLVDVALLPAYRGNGIGTALVASVVDDGTRAGVPVRLEVLAGSPAVRLYERAGFVRRQPSPSADGDGTGGDGSAVPVAEMYVAMERAPW